MVSSPRCAARGNGQDLLKAACGHAAWDSGHDHSALLPRQRQLRAPPILLREIGAPFQLQLVDRTQAAHKSPEYLKLNPNGLIPVLVDGELVATGNTDGAAQVKAAAEARLVGCLAQIDAQLAGHSGHWPLGEKFSAVYPLAFMLCRWTRGFARKPARNCAHIGPYLQRMLARPAVMAAIAEEKLSPPLV